MKKNQRYYQQLCKQHGEDDWGFYHTIHMTYGMNEYAEAFMFEDRSWTYAMLRGEVGRLALNFQEMGIKNRTVVGMYINNSPEFIFSWWALYKLGAIPAPVNTAVTKEPFRHCVRISNAEYMICTYELFDVMVATLDATSVAPRSNQTLAYDHADLPRLKTIVLYDYSTYPPISKTIPSACKSALVHDSLPSTTSSMSDWPASTRPKVRQDDTSQYLFTSGTTGLPKASIWPAAHSMMGAGPQRWPMMWEKHRRFYLCTPMFHGGAAFAVLPATFATSGTVILARKFSRQKFWHDIRRTRANGIFYIGEMIRYLAQAEPDPHHPDETKMHALEIIYGIGISEPIWKLFRTRFGVPWIAEYYGASEGTIAICNSNFSNDAGVAKVAHWGPLMRSRWFGQDTFHIIQVDLETGDVIRDAKTGLCIKCRFDEIGEAINRIVPPLQRKHDYVGEGGVEATEKKTLRDVFEKGDEFFRLGDALSMDRKGYVTFHDRMGDTYRAKGHNISTAEVENAFLQHPHISSANVYSINMKSYGYDGQLGCAAVTLRAGASPLEASFAEHETIRGLEKWLVSEAGLAVYAVPRFLRILVDVSEADAAERDQLGISDDVGSERVSVMMKKLKTGLRKEGEFRPRRSDVARIPLTRAAFLLPETCKDRLYLIEREGSGFVELRPQMIQALQGGRARL